METNEPITIVYTEHGMCLTSKQYGSWRDIQDAFEDYKASLGPFSVDELVEFLRSDFVEPPFDLNDVRRVAIESDAYSWAATESLPPGVVERGVNRWTAGEFL